MLFLYAALFAAIVSGFGVWKVQDWRQDAKDKERIEAAAKEFKQRLDRSDKASEGFEKAKAVTYVKFSVITETVEKIVDRPVYRTVCFDDAGLRAISDSVQLTAPASESKGAVPAAKKPD